MLKELEAHLRSDWWTIGDACQIFAGYVPIPETDNNQALSKFLRIDSAEQCPKSNVRDSVTQVRDRWTNCFHWYEEPASLKFKKTDGDDLWLWQVSKTYAILWALDQELNVKSWVKEAIDLGFLAEVPE